MRKSVIIKDLKLAVIAFLLLSAASLVTETPFEIALGVPVGIMLASLLYEFVR